MIDIDLSQISNQQFCQSTPYPHFVGGGGILTLIQARSTINMERINNQHFTVHLNCPLVIIEPGGAEPSSPTISVRSTGLKLVYLKNRSLFQPSEVPWASHNMVPTFSD